MMVWVEIAFLVVGVLVLGLCTGLLLYVFVRGEHSARKRMPRGRAEEVVRTDNTGTHGKDR